MPTTAIETLAPLDRATSKRLASTEYDRLVEQLRSLSDADWSEPTDCPLWDVRSMAGHSVGMLSDFTSLRSVLRRMRAATRAAKRTGGAVIDSMTALQVAELADLSVDELIALAEVNGPRAAHWRANAPALLRRMPMKEEVGGSPETWTLGYLFDVILTRDPWMHRVDIARATGRPMVLTPEHDGRLVADAVAEWARRHGRAVTLVLTGPAGGEFHAGSEPGETITMDAVEFCRLLSGRSPGTGLLAQEVPF